MRDGCEGPRDLALADLPASTGMRMCKLVQPNKSDVDLEERESDVPGKADRQRVACFDARATVQLERCLAVFV